MVFLQWFFTQNLKDWSATKLMYLKSIMMLFHNDCNMLAKTNTCTLSWISILATYICHYTNFIIEHFFVSAVFKYIAGHIFRTDMQWPIRKSKRKVLITKHSTPTCKHSTRQWSNRSLQYCFSFNTGKY